jgi:hypothetical protein
VRLNLSAKANIVVHVRSPGAVGDSSSSLTHETERSSHRAFASSGAQVFGDDIEKAIPDPIPNSEVKLLRADGTAQTPVWESRTSPGYSPSLGSLRSGAFFISSGDNRSLPRLLPDSASVSLATRFYRSSYLIVHPCQTKAVLVGESPLRVTESHSINERSSFRIEVRGWSNRRVGTTTSFRIEVRGWHNR